MNWFYKTIKARGLAQDVYHNISDGDTGFQVALRNKRNEAALAVLELYKYKGYAIPSEEFAEFCIRHLDYGRMNSIADMSIFWYDFNSGRQGPKSFYKDTNVQVRSANQMLRRIQEMCLGDVEDELLIQGHEIMSKSKWMFEDMDGQDVWIRLAQNTREVDWWEGK
jgi:hypothetical protein